MTQKFELGGMSLAEYLEEAIGTFFESFECTDTERIIEERASIAQLAETYPIIDLKEGEYLLSGEGRNPATYGWLNWDGAGDDVFQQWSEEVHAKLEELKYFLPPIHVQLPDKSWVFVMERTLDDPGDEFLAACRNFNNAEELVAWANSL